MFNSGGLHKLNAVLSNNMHHIIQFLLEDLEVAITE